ncbi:MAG TPA: hypothetical protein VMH04_09055 [Candidatus Solibacter sp.]|nr:hypothetical protein [Candidatus Solibacter sp.]
MRDPKSEGVATAAKRQRAQVKSSLEQKLMAYAATATAAGVAMLAAPQSAEAKIVYTAVNAQIGHAYPLDLNADGMIDFYLMNGGSASIAGSFRISYLDVCHIGASRCVESSSMLQANANNQVRETASGAAALPFGAKIGPGEQWGGKGQAVGMGARVFYSGSNTAQRWEGPWANDGHGVTNKYLGFKFKVGNMFHYGWARVTFTTLARGYQATITGYAYETIPGKAILAGHTSGPAEQADLLAPGYLEEKVPVEQASLGMLATGSSGLSIWRKEETRN